MTMRLAQHPRDIVNGLYLSRKKQEEDSAALKIASVQRYKDSKTSWKKCKENW